MVVRVILIKFSPDNLRTVTDAMRNMLFESSYALGRIDNKNPSVILSLYFVICNIYVYLQASVDIGWTQTLSKYKNS